MTRIRISRRKRTDAPKQPLTAPGATQTARAVQRLIAAESARVVPSEKQLDGLAEISDADIAHAVSEWDAAQKDADTGLDGLLGARVNPRSASEGGSGMTTDEMIEALADKEHDSWSRWMKYLFSKCEIHGLVVDTGILCIPADLVDRWTRQASTPYSELSEPEKQSDRDEVERILPIIREWADSKVDKT